MSAIDLTSLLARGPLLLDGALGTELIARGLAAGQAPERWVLEHPDRIAAVHRAYAEAGADVVQACTFGANEPRLAAEGLGGRVAEINAAAVRLARDAVGPGVLVSADLGPTGRFMPPMGDATAEQLRGVFAEQSAVLAEAGLDLVTIETMYDLREALIAVEEARRAGLVVLASMTFDVRKRGVFTMVGDKLIPSLQALAEAGAAAVGFNCTVTSEVMLDMVRQAAGAIEVPLLAQPNAGQPRPTPEGVVYDADPDRFAADLAAMVEAGARIVGGCCGTTPEFIARVRAALP
jgi:5-methyltetrahydrofolate--homocysteine methyltransferase